MYLFVIFDGVVHNNNSLDEGGASGALLSRGYDDRGLDISANRFRPIEEFQITYTELSLQRQPETSRNCVHS